MSEKYVVSREYFPGRYDEKKENKGAYINEKVNRWNLVKLDF